MKWIPIILCTQLFQAAAAEVQLAPVFQDNTNQFTGVAVSKAGRLFVNYPRWEGPHQFDVVEVQSNGTARPFPDAEWNHWREGESSSNHWICVQALYVDAADRLWVVDPAAPGMGKVVDHGAKLVVFDLDATTPERVYNLADAVGENSYLNDVRVDLQRHVAYLTESKVGGLVVLQTESGQARVVLRNKPCVTADANHRLTVGGEELKREGKPMKINADSIALSPDRIWLYFKPLSDTKLYRVKTEDLLNEKLNDDQLEKKVHDMGSHFTASDGMIFDHSDNLYLSDMEHDAIVMVTQDHHVRRVVQDKRLLWPDSFAWSPDGWLYVTCSQIQNMPWSHGGQSTRTTPYTIYKLRPASGAPATAAR